MKIQSNIYSFSDYREFLKDRYRQLKETDPAFSFRSFSKDAGFGSPNYLKLVMDNKRNLSEEAVGKFAKGLRLDSHESEYFKYMVAHNQCDHAQKKEVYEAKLTYLQELFKVKDLIPELYDYYHDWYHAAIREVVKKGAIKNDPAVIGQKLVPALSAEDTQKSVDLLKKLNFVRENLDGFLEPAERTESLDHEAADKIYQEQMAELAAQSIYTQGPETQGFESVTISMPIEKVNELKAKIKEWVGEMQTQSSTNPTDAVYQLNVQFFALTRKQEDNVEMSA